MLSFITRHDVRVMLRANTWPAPRWVRMWALAATRAGDGWLWCIAGVAILLFGGEDRFAAVGAAGLAALMARVRSLEAVRHPGRPTVVAKVPTDLAADRGYRKGQEV